MDPRYPATRAALKHFDLVDAPALAALCATEGNGPDFVRHNAARTLAADRVRAAFLADCRDFASPHNVELMSVDTIRRSAGGTLLGKLLGLLP